MWVRFTADFDFKPEAVRGRVVIAYRAGMIQNVTRACADKAFALGVAVKEPAPRKTGK